MNDHFYKADRRGILNYAIQIIFDSLEERGIRNSVIKCHKGKGGQQKCHVTFFNFLRHICVFKTLNLEEMKCHVIPGEGVKASLIFWMAPNRKFYIQVRLLQVGLLLQLHGRPHDEGEERALRRNGFHSRKVEKNAIPMTFKWQQSQSQ